MSGSYPDYQTILVEPQAGPAGLVRLTLNRPSQLNALSAELLDELFDAVERFDQDPQGYVLAIAGAGRAFSSGYDLVSRNTAEPGAPGDMVAEQSVGRSRRIMLGSVDRYLRLWNLRKPTIAQVHGYCLSGGTELSAMCDFIVCAESARFGHIAGRHMGTLRTLSLWPYTIGMRHAKEIFMTGELIDGVTAERWGLVNKAVPDEDLGRAVEHLARQIMRIPLEINSLHKHAVNRWLEIQGLYAAMHSAAEFDVYTSFIEGRPGFRERVASEGLSAALKWRDAPWQGTSLWRYGQTGDDDSTTPG
jgi:enoyl-CoA hydratase